MGTRDGHLIAYGSSAAAPVQAAALDAGQVAVGTSKTLTLSISATTPLKITVPSPSPVRKARPASQR